MQGGRRQLQHRPQRLRAQRVLCGRVLHWRRQRAGVLPHDDQERLPRGRQLAGGPLLLRAQLLPSGACSTSALCTHGGALQLRPVDNPCDWLRSSKCQPNARGPASLRQQPTRPRPRRAARRPPPIRSPAWPSARRAAQTATSAARASAASSRARAGSRSTTACRTSAAATVSVVASQRAAHAAPSRAAPSAAAAWSAPSTPTATASAAAAPPRRAAAAARSSGSAAPASSARPASACAQRAHRHQAAAPGTAPACCRTIWAASRCATRRALARQLERFVRTAGKLRPCSARITHVRRNPLPSCLRVPA